MKKQRSIKKKKVPANANANARGSVAIPLPQGILIFRFYCFSNLKFEFTFYNFNSYFQILKSFIKFEISKKFELENGPPYSDPSILTNTKIFMFYGLQRDKNAYSLGHFLFILKI